MRLRLTLRADTDGTAELFVEAEANGFAGRSSAWFDLQEISEFAVALEAFPIRVEEPPALAGGFGSQTGSGALEQRHVSLLVVPINRRGTLGIQVQLATPEWPDARPGSAYRVALEVQTEYAALQEFARSVAALAAGAAEEAVLKSEVKTW